jgi:hypothetical protein
MNARSESKITKLAVALIFLSLAYVFGSWAVDSGSLWHYFAAFAFLLLTVKTITRTFKTDGKK